MSDFTGLFSVDDVRVGTYCKRTERVQIGRSHFALERTCRIVEDEDGRSACSECGAHYPRLSEAAYCPGCGAKVEGDRLVVVECRGGWAE